MKKELDVVYVTHDSLSEGIGMSQIVPLLIGLSNKGFRVGVISCEKVSPPRALRETLIQSGILWKPINFGRFGALGGVGRILRIASKLPKASVYHCRGDISATATSLRTRSPFIWDVRGLWLDQKIILSNLGRAKFIIRIAKLLEKRAATKASAVTTLTAAVYPVLLRRHPGLTHKHSVIPTCVDLIKFPFIPDLPKEKNLLLSGVFNNYYDLDKTKLFISRIKKELDITITWCHGKEADRQTLEVGEEVIKTMIQTEMPAEIANASFGVAFCKEDAGESLLGVMPTKVAEFLATGRPVVVSRGIGDLGGILTKHQAGIILDQNVDKAIQELKELLVDPKMPIRCRKLAEEHFSMEKAIDAYYAILLELIKSTSRLPNAQ
jgi:glycosyltransferase involved in cell wall biosynthesis